MEWFVQWWLELGIVGQIMATAAMPMTVVMLLQLLLMIFGFGFGLPDSDVGADSPDSPANAAGSYGNASIFRVFTVRGIVAFFALGGWAGLAALSAGIPTLWSIQIALLAGAAALMLASFVIRLALRMQDSGNLNINNALSQPGEVYITIPPSRTKAGKVMLLLQERFVELDAVTDNETALSPKTKVEVIGVIDNDCLLVRPITEQN
ncbi:MAG: hypothetical protein FWB97_04730 [Oscillospiraceae bacterium]|nr:hypothetical protein [Oscillospiraceae bacterium]